MPGFDAEYYLRCAAEDALALRDGRGIDDRARTLVAVGALSQADAKAIVASYAHAWHLRGLGRERFRTSSPHRPDEPRFCAAARTIDQPWGTVRLRYVSLTADTTEIAAVVDLKPGASSPRVTGRRGPRPRFRDAGPPAIRVKDDHRHSVEAGFSGSGSDDQWRGTWSVSPGLALDATWIELLGERIELSDVTTAASVRVAQLDTGTESITVRAERHLEHRLEALNSWRGDSQGIDDSIETLVAAGALSADAPLVPRVRAVAKALTMGTGGPVQDVSPRWQSILHPARRRSAPDRTMLAGVTTPEFDGVCLSILTLEVTSNVLEFDFKGMGSLAVRNSPQSRVDDVQLTFTASDDRNNHYLGQLHSYGSSGNEIDGSVKFMPSLDPDATELELVLSTDRARATIALPLSWEPTL